jgi:hypothetical protein
MEFRVMRILLVDDLMEAEVEAGVAAAAGAGAIGTTPQAFPDGQEPDAVSWHGAAQQVCLLRQSLQLDSNSIPLKDRLNILEMHSVTSISA